ncbi:hypothetical protein [Micromonospora sp. NBC_00858]|uniref:hypothetical protein n=1 Tax=Micromonospora sp. NBC_00858 TaxID=2975979 RepID=UPI00386CD5ED|nr:hypothetical protein OG990_30320 [Micromonospora sp. NBC_00858]
MPENPEQAAPARRVWRPTAGTGRVADSDIVPVCSGVVVDIQGRYERMWALKRQMQREAEVEKETEEREAARHPSHHRQPASRDEEEDEEKAAERRRNDRYAVKLLRQEESVWAGGGADTGVLG